MTSVVDALEDIFVKCWAIWNYEFNFGGGIVFSLKHVAITVVLIWIVSLAIGTLLDDDWGA